MLHEEYIKSIIIITIMHYFMYAVVQFNFSTSELVIGENGNLRNELSIVCLLYTSPSPRDATLSRMPSSA